MKVGIGIQEIVISLLVWLTFQFEQIVDSQSVGQGGVFNTQVSSVCLEASSVSFLPCSRSSLGNEFLQLVTTPISSCQLSTRISGDYSLLTEILVLMIMDARLLSRYRLSIEELQMINPFDSCQRYLKGFGKDDWGQSEPEGQSDVDI
ncbi:MAG: hypothetical protein EZS28_030427 [Streblomastix strix]|uniref:Uncharacterized protein n=1 Tax=Streblomastix strix TaxID=222440 RepID=A0A5J4UUH1_9EUKA|nr:MAG: hypothetical protein EZS28_030427 [Streblomastix strix]